MRRYGIPPAVVRSAYRDNHEHRRRVHEGLASVRVLCERVGLCRGPARLLWHGLGLSPRARNTVHTPLALGR